MESRSPDARKGIDKSAAAKRRLVFEKISFERRLLEGSAGRAGPVPRGTSGGRICAQGLNTWGSVAGGREAGNEVDGRVLRRRNLWKRVGWWVDVGQWIVGSC